MRQSIATILVLALSLAAKPAAAGVCCLPDGGCTITDINDCIGVQGGAFWEDGTTCEPNPCGAVGACCAWQGSQGGPVCSVTTGTGCATAGEFGDPGGWYGPGTDCVPDPCQGEQPCCLPDHSCVWLAVFDCEAQGGVALGAGAACDPNPCPVPYGACCYEWGAHCADVTDAQCAHFEGAVFQGDGTRCASLQCADRQGACCLSDGSCFRAPEFVCMTAQGQYAGDGTDCIDGACPPVATERTTWGRIKHRY